jgi:hypothetical protein
MDNGFTALLKNYYMEMFCLPIKDKLAKLGKHFT